MPVYYKLDKIFDVGKEYTTEERRFYVIKRKGTNATSDVKLNIGGVKTGVFVDVIAPLHKTTSNLLGPLDLGDLIEVIPPDTSFVFEGPSGTKVRAIGKIGHLGVGEVFPTDLLARYDAQGKHYKDYITASVSLGTDEVWADGRELKVVEVTPKTTEVFRFKHPVLAKITGDTITEGQVGIRFYKADSPLDIFLTKAGRLGIDVLSMPCPPAGTTEMEPFTLEDFPIELPGDVVLRVTAINVSGAGLTPATGAAWSVRVYLIREYQFLK